jgi:hypothetical protein
MRCSLIAAAVLFSCTDLDHAAPTIQTLARQDGTPAAPLTVCDSLSEGSVALRFRVVGTGFVSEVRNATSDSPTLLAPTVQITGPQGTSFVPTQIARSAERIDITMPGASGQNPMRFADGAYSVAVVDPDATAAELANALVFQPPPTVTSVSPTTICANAPATVVIRGGPFSPGATVAVFTGAAISPSFPTRFDAPDQIAVTFPPGTGAGLTNLQLSITDPDGCGAAASVGQACP